MINILKSVIINVLTALYMPFWSAILMSILVMFTIMQGENIGYKSLCKRWVKKLREDRQFRKTFLLVFYTVMILYRTLLLRSMYNNPLKDGERLFIAI